MKKKKIMPKTGMSAKRLVDHAAMDSPSASPYEQEKDLFGRFGSGTSNLSRDYKLILNEKLRDKHSH